MIRIKNGYMAGREQITAKHSRYAVSVLEKLEHAHATVDFGIDGMQQCLHISTKHFFPSAESCSDSSHALHLEASAFEEMLPQEPHTTAPMVRINDAPRSGTFTQVGHLAYVKGHHCSQQSQHQTTAVLSE